MPTSYSTVSLVLFFIAALIFYREEKTYFTLPLSSKKYDFLYWQAVLTVVLLCGPCSWVMNAVWLLPGVYILISEYSRLQGKDHAIALALVALGLFFVGIPDHRTFELLLPKGRSLVPYKYIVGELMILTGWLLVLHYHYRNAQNAGEPISQ